MIGSLKILATTLFISGMLLFSSCGNGHDEENADSAAQHDTALHRLDPDSVAKADSTVTAVNHISKEDSTRIADSIQNLKDPVRDFN